MSKAGQMNVQGWQPEALEDLIRDLAKEGK